MNYLITHKNQPKLFEIFKAPTNTNAFVAQQNGQHTYTQSSKLEQFFNKDTQLLELPFPLDSIMIRKDYYYGERTVYILPSLIEQQFYYRFRLKMDIDEYFKSIEPMFIQLIKQLKEKNLLYIIEDVLLDELNSAHYQDIRPFLFLTRLMEFDFNHVFKFNPYFSTTKLGLFGFTSLMLAKGKKFVDYLITQKINYSITSNPLDYYELYQTWFNNTLVKPAPNGYTHEALTKSYFEKRHHKNALEIGIIEKRKYLIDGIKKDILIHEKEVGDKQVKSLEEFEKNAYEKIIHTKKLSTRFNLLAKEFKNNNQYLYHHLDDPLLREVYALVDGHKKDLVYYAIKHKNLDILTYLIQQPEILDMAQKNHFRMQDNMKKSYLYVAYEIGNKNLIKVLYDAHFYQLNANDLIEFSFRANLPHIFSDTYKTEKENIHIEYLLMPAHLNLLKDYLDTVHYKKEDLKIALSSMSRVIYIMSAKNKYHPVMSSLHYGEHFNEVYFLLASQLTEDEVLECFKEGSKTIMKGQEIVADRFIGNVKKNLYQFYLAFIKHYPHLEKKAFEVMSTIFPEHSEFIASEKKLLNSILTAKINKEDTKKTKI